jgi:glycosyltransferase involved in cell wall biosynthesis
MRNAVVLICYNTTPAQLELTKETYASIMAQDIEIEPVVVDNGSTPETIEWLKSLSPMPWVEYYPTNMSPLKVTNDLFAHLFLRGYQHILGVPNDVVLPPNLYRELAACPRGVVAAWMNENRSEVQPCTAAKAVHEDIHTAVLMTRTWAYHALVDTYGYFLDEGFFFYANDCDFKMRLAACGIRGAQLDIQCYHYSGASHRLAAPGIGKGITDQADRDREYFERKWGFKIGSDEYNKALVDLNWRGK